MKGRLFAAAFLAAWALLCAGPKTAWAMEPGAYLVTVKPSYTDPESGKVEDPGNNEAIGQGMTEKLCGPAGLLEIEADGTMYLTVRYYLSQFIREVTFEERRNGSYTTLSFDTMQTKDSVAGSADIDEKYGFTDYRMKIAGQDSVFRGKAYVEPMGRSVVYFFVFSNPVAGSGDFKVSAPLGQPEPESGTGQAVQPGGNEDEARLYQSYEEADGERRDQPDRPQDQPAALSGGGGGIQADTAAGGANGSGDPGAAVTGIPQKPGRAAAADKIPLITQTRMAAEGDGAVSDSAESYHLDTKYDLTSVPIREARKLAKPMLEAAVGITGMTGMTGSTDYPENRSSRETGNVNKTIMVVLLAVSGGLLVRFAGTAVLRPVRRRSGAADGSLEEQAPRYGEYQEAAALLEQEYQESMARLRQEYCVKLETGAGDKKGEDEEI